MTRLKLEINPSFRAQDGGPQAAAAGRYPSGVGFAQSASPAHLIQDARVGLFFRDQIHRLGIGGVHVYVFVLPA